MRPPPRKFRILFVCVGNACRSPIAEAVARHVASDVIEASSAGIAPLGRIEQTTQETLIANGYAHRGLTSKGLSRAAIENADLVINMSGRTLDGIFDNSRAASGSNLARKVEVWNVADPYGETGAVYQKILEELETKILLLASRLRDRQRNGNS